METKSDSYVKLIDGHACFVTVKVNKFVISFLYTLQLSYFATSSLHVYFIKKETLVIFRHLTRPGYSRRTLLGRSWLIQRHRLQEWYMMVQKKNFHGT